ncbi:MAG: AI-2E family transporter [Cyanobacteria bacterium P01_F01_bin.150]
MWLLMELSAVKFGQWLGLICLAIALFILWHIRQMVLLILAAVILATALNGLTRQWRRVGIRDRKLSVMLTLTTVGFCGFLFVALVIPPFIEQFQSLLEEIPRSFIVAARNIETFINNPPERLETFVRNNLQDSFNDSIDLTALTSQVQPLLQNLIQNGVDLFNSSLNVLWQFLLVIVMTLMLFSNPQGYRQVMIKLFPSFYRRRADAILTKCEIALGNWMGGILINSLFVASMSWIGLSALKIDLELAHALLAGLLNFIPNVGPFISVIFPLSVALQDPSWKIIAIIILYMAIQNIESYWISPMVMAKQVSLLPAITLSAQVFFATFFGLLGLILALPLTVITKTWIREALIKDILDRYGVDDQPTINDPDVVEGEEEGAIALSQEPQPSSLETTKQPSAEVMLLASQNHELSDLAKDDHVNN